MTRILVSIYLLSSSLLGLANVDLLTNIRDVYVLGDDELVGAIGFRVAGNDFSEMAGSPIDRTHPVYIRLFFQDGIRLSRTLVDTTNGDHPINLHTQLIKSDANNPISSAMEPDAVQLIRAIAGERSVWIRVLSASDHWLDADGDEIGDLAPTQDASIMFQIGTSAGILNSVDTSLWIDVTSNACGTLEADGILSFQPTAYTILSEPGEPGTPESAPAEVLDPQSCSYDGGVEDGLLAPAPIFFSADNAVGRGRTEPLVGLEIFGTDQAYVNQLIEFHANLSGHAKRAAVHWDFGDDRKDDDDMGTTFRYRFEEAGTYDLTATISNPEGFSFTAMKTVTVGTAPDMGDQVSYLPHLTRVDGGFKSDIIIENDGLQPQSYLIVGYDGDGHIIAEREQTIGPATDGPRVDVHSADSVLGTQAAHAEVIGDVSVVVAYDRSSGVPNPTHIPAAPLPELQWKIHLGNPELIWDGMAVINQGDTPTTVTLTHFGPSGEFRGRIVLNDALNAKAKLLYVVDRSRFMDGERGVLVVASSAAPIHVVALRGDVGNNLLWHNPIQSRE